MIRPTNDKGYVALLTVLVVGAATTAMALALLTIGTDSQRSSLVTQQTAQARQLASACAEEGLQQINDVVSYTGTGNVSLGVGTCSYTVTNTGAATRTITTSGTVNTVVRKLTVYVTISASSISVTSWQDVP